MVLSTAHLDLMVECQTSSDEEAEDNDGDSKDDRAHDAL